MDRHLYTAAELGDWEAIRQFESQLYSQRTPNKDTVLHILAQFCESSSAVEQILATNPKLLSTLNAECQTPLHLAAREGHSNVVRALINCARQSNILKPLLRTADKCGNLAIHEAAKGNYDDIVELFIQEDSILICFKNKEKKSPLYVAIEKGRQRSAITILSNYVQELDDAVGRKSNIGTGPDGRTVLHAAAVANLPACVRLICEKLPHLIEKVDCFGCTPLHYAARLNHQEMARELLDVKVSMAYLKSSRTQNVLLHMLGPFKEHFHKTALHVAVEHGQKKVIEELLSICPDCWQMVTSKNKNVIHLAVECEQQEVLDFILEKSWASCLINQKDCDGNTPLHLYAATENLVGHNLVNHPKVDRNASSSRGRTPLDLVRFPRIPTRGMTRERQLLIKTGLERVGATMSSIHTIFPKALAKEAYDTAVRTRETYLIVAVLLATVTFQAAFTVPGGYDSKEGTPILQHNTAFQWFWACDMGALLVSIAAVICLLALPNLRYYKTHSSFLKISGFFIREAILLMMASFSFGLSATMPTSVFLSAIVGVFSILILYYTVIWK